MRLFLQRLFVALNEPLSDQDAGITVGMVAHPAGFAEAERRARGVALFWLSLVVANERGTTAVAFPARIARIHMAGTSSILKRSLHQGHFPCCFFSSAPSAFVNKGYRPRAPVEKSGGFLKISLKQLGASQHNEAAIQIVQHMALVSIYPHTAALPSVTHLGVFDADASIFRHAFDQADFPTLINRYILHVDLLGDFQDRLRQLRLISRQGLHPTFYCL